MLNYHSIMSCWGGNMEEGSRWALFLPSEVRDAMHFGDNVVSLFLSQAHKGGTLCLIWGTCGRKQVYEFLQLTEATLHSNIVDSSHQELFFKFQGKPWSLHWHRRAPSCYGEVEKAPQKEEQGIYQYLNKWNELSNVVSKGVACWWIMPQFIK